MANTVLTPATLISRGKWHDYREGIWGDSFDWSWIRPWDQLVGILIHHSVTIKEATPDDIALLHKARGWGGIGYHFVITRDGVVHYVGDIATARAHVLDKNEKFLGVCMIGDFTQYLPSDEQIKSAHDLCDYLLHLPSIPSLYNWSQVQGHKDQQATECPGASWPDDMKYRIEKRVPYTPDAPEIPTPPTPVEPTPDWKQKYEDEVNAHTNTKEVLKRFKEDAILDKENAVKDALNKLNAKIDTAQIAE